MSTALRRLAAAAIAVAGLLHLILVPEYLAEAWPVGVSFLVAAGITGGVAVVLWRTQSPTAWLVGALTSAGIVAGFVLSRTVGLLGYRSSNWAEGFPSLAVEVLFLGLAASYVRYRADAGAPAPIR